MNCFSMNITDGLQWRTNRSTFSLTALLFLIASFVCDGCIPANAFLLAKSYNVCSFLCDLIGTMGMTSEKDWKSIGTFQIVADACAFLKSIHPRVFKVYHVTLMLNPIHCSWRGNASSVKSIVISLVTLHTLVFLRW